MITVTIDKVFKNKKTTKFGEKLSVGLKIKETTVKDINGEDVTIGDRYLNAWFPADYDFTPQAGDTIDILVKQRGEWLDFSTKEQAANSKSGQADRLTALEARVRKLEEAAALDRGESIADEVEPDF